MGAVRCEGVDPGSLICMSKTMPDLGLALWSLLARNVNANAKGGKREGAEQKTSHLERSHCTLCLFSIQFNPAL